MPVRSVALLICGVILAAAITIAVAFVAVGTFSTLAGAMVMVVLLVAAVLVRRSGR